jgi:DNA-binding NarL/FixJ family response regulator
MKLRHTNKIPDDIDKKILSLLSHGYTYQQIGNEIYRSSEAVKKRLQVLKTYYRCKNNNELVSYCTKNDIYKELPL